MGKRSAVVELFLGDMGSIQRELRPSTQREDQLTMETKLEQIAVKAVNQLPKSVVREIRTPRSVGAGGGRPPPATRWARRNPRPYRDHRASDGSLHCYFVIIRLVAGGGAAAGEMANVSHVFQPVGRSEPANSA